MLIDHLPHNQNMDSTTSSTESIYGGHQNTPAMECGHNCINMMSDSYVVTHSQDYGLSQPNMGKEPTTTGIPLHIDKLEFIHCIPKGFLKHSGHNPNSRAT